MGAIRNGRRMEMNFLSFSEQGGEWKSWTSDRGRHNLAPSLPARSLRYLRNVFDEGEISCHVETLFRSVI